MKKAWLLATLLFFAPLCAQQTYVAKDYSNLIGMTGFSDKALNTHFKLYQGYVTNINKLMALLPSLNNPDHVSEYSAIKLRLGWEWDGMRLHEYYFDNLGGNGQLDPNSPLAAALTQNFGSYDNWKSDFVATGLIRGIGWSVLYQDAKTGKLINVWINEHDLGHLAGGKPLLIMDVFEHAYMLDYLTDRAAYIDAFFKNIDWSVVNNRYQAK